ncbi:hypothetical protein JCM5353_008237 [Sporobolomyces roseus]
MSLLTDNDFLLRAFQLSYIRQVLPNHAPNSSRSGQGPYNLVKFPQDTERALSPYISLSGLSDEQQWPELSSGRSSPPMALTLARDPSRSSQPGSGADTPELQNARNRRRRGGPGNLGYTQTIIGKGSGVGGAGMRVDGVKRSWKGKGKLFEAGQEDETEGNEELARRASLIDTSNGRLLPNLMPPPVIIHSPVRTPRDSPAAQYRPHNIPDSSHALLSELHPPHPSPLAHDPNATITATRKPRFSTSANEYHSYPDHDLPNPHSSHSFVESPSSSLVEIGEDYPSQPNSQVTDTSSAFQAGPSAPASPLSLPQTNSASPSPSSPSIIPSPARPQPSTNRESRFATPSYDSSSIADEAPIADTLVSSDFPDGPLINQVNQRGGGPVSMASSGISLFGTSRLERSTELTRGGEDSSDQSEVERRRRTGGGGGRARTDSDFSLASNPSLAQPPPPPAPVEAPIATPGVPVFKLPPGMRVRERRRVNIRPGPGGALFVPNLTPVPPPLSNDQPTFAIDTEKREAPSGAIGNRSRSSTGTSSAQPASPSSPTSPKRPPLSPARTRKVSGAATAEPSPSSLGAKSEIEKLAPPSPGGSKSPRRRSDPPSPLLSFPKRSSYVQLTPPSSHLALPNASKSALTALLTSPSSSSLSNSNPFSTLYAACVSRSTSALDTITLALFFPLCTKPGPSKPLKVGVKRDVTVEEVIGVALWAYWEEQEKGEREPRLGVDEEEAEGGNETTKWNLRIVEDDGEVDEDFPALDRVRAISAFSFTEFAIVKATEQQVRDNSTKQATITRRPSRILAGPKRVPSGPIPIGATLAPPPQLPQQPLPNPSSSNFALPPAPTNANEASFRPTTQAIGTFGASSAMAVPVQLKVQLPVAGAGVERFTTVEVPSDMYLVDVLEHICRKRNLGNAEQWALIVRLSDGDIVVPLDRTVESLGDQHEVVLVARSQVGTVGLRQRRNPQNIDPSASIFQQQAEEPTTPRYQSASQLTSTYQLYRVQRKLPMSLGGRHPRTIAIDGDYLHFMPDDGGDSAGRTSSFHISLVQSCKVSRRSPSSFKIVVRKRYDFEAESPAMASEIVDAIRAVMESWRIEQGVLARRRGR